MKKSLTSGDIAQHCEVSVRTAIRWIDNGRLKGYKLPGRGDNRVKVTDFIIFLKTNNLPIPEIFQNRSQRILIIDDDKNMAQSIKRQLKKYDFEIKLITDPFKAGALLGSYQPDLITLDLKMPRMNGFEIIKFIRSSQKYNHIKILTISGLNRKQLEKSIAAGANSFLEKPFEKNELLEKISELIGTQNET